MRAWRAGCGRHAFLPLLAAIEEAGDEEQQREHEGEFGVRRACRRSRKTPSRTMRPSDEPYPGSLAHPQYHDPRAEF